MTAADVVLRLGEPADAAALLAVSLAAIRTSAAEHYSPGQLEAWASRRTVEDHLRMIEQTTLLVAEVDGEVAGFANLVVDQGLVDQLFVSPAAGGRGVARALLTALEDHAVAAGVPELHSHASWRAVQVFERLGYERVTVEAVDVGAERLTRVLVRRALAPPRGSVPPAR